MENISVLNNTFLIDGKNNQENINWKKRSSRGTGLSSSLFNMVAEGVVNFLSFIKSPRVSKEPVLMILSSKQHYYNENDFRSVRASVNLKKLNHINHLDMFLSDVIRISPPDTNFMGYYSDNKTPEGNGNPFYQLPGLWNRFFNFQDPGTAHNMDKNEVLGLLETYGFKIIDMNDTSGLTFFHS
jgi:hypothetical protein